MKAKAPVPELLLIKYSNPAESDCKTPVLGLNSHLFSLHNEDSA